VSAPSILIYGAGGVGAFFGALLAHAGRDVHFVARGAQLEAMRRDGLHVRSSLIDDVHVPRVQVHARAGDAPQADLILVCVKTDQSRCARCSRQPVSASRFPPTFSTNACAS
jgi:2-dehydropantoate 2-reductase